MYYDSNYPAMLAMIEYAGYGLEGTVTDAISGDPVAAIVLVEDYMQTYSDPTVGDYHKYVLTRNLLNKNDGQWLRNTDYR